MGSSDAHPQVLEEVVFHLVSQLGEHNPALKSTALIQASIPLEYRVAELIWKSAGRADEALQEVAARIFIAFPPSDCAVCHRSQMHEPRIVYRDVSVSMCLSERLLIHYAPACAPSPLCRTRGQSTRRDFERTGQEIVHTVPWRCLPDPLARISTSRARADEPGAGFYRENSSSRR